jgi:hypothetical protein
MLDGEEISPFESNEFLQVNQAVKKYAYLSIEFLKFMEVEVTFLRWLYHIIHLAEEINEQNLLMI